MKQTRKLYRCYDSTSWVVRDSACKLRSSDCRCLGCKGENVYVLQPRKRKAAKLKGGK